MINFKSEEVQYTFDDVALVPQFNKVRSRRDVNLSSNGHLGYLGCPLISANMDTVTGAEMLQKMFQLGGRGVLHRFMSRHELLNSIRSFYESFGESIDSLDLSNTKGFNNLILSVGVNDDYSTIAELCRYSKTLCIDIAHGHSSYVANTIRNIRSGNPHAVIIAGNVATREGTRFLAESGADVIKCGLGSGCFVGTTRILMANGEYKNIKDIKIHDRVINKDGKSVEVIGVKFSGIKPVLNYKNNLWYNKTYCTEDHRHWIGDISSSPKSIGSEGRVKTLSKLAKTKPKSSKFKWAEIGECKNTSTHLLLMPRTIKFDLAESFELDLKSFAQRKHFFDQRGYVDKVGPSYNLGYIFGTFLGDGNATVVKTQSKTMGGETTSGQVCWSFGKEEKKIAAKLAKALKSTFNIKASIDCKRANMISVRASVLPLARVFKQFGKKTAKHLPRDYFCGNTEYMKGLLDGLIDSDGCVSGGRIMLSNTSSHIIELFSVLFFSVKGYWPSVTRKPPTVGGLSNIKLENCNESFLARSLKCPQNSLTPDYQINTINNMNSTLVYLPTYDIEVDCDTHSFIANNAIVHNSICSTRVVTGHGIPQLSALSECVDEADVLSEELSRNIEVISDGGHRSSGDIAKALAVGANYVMLGNLLAGCDECPGDIITIDGAKFKQYRGSASKEIQQDLGKVHAAAEGVSHFKPYKGSVEDVIKELCGGLASALTYSGTSTLKDFRNAAKFIRVSHSAYIEGTPHGITT